MITNIVATVTVCLVTNVSEKFPQHLEPLFEPGIFSLPSGFSDCVYHGHYVNDENPTEKDVVTEISSVKTIDFEFEGKPFKILTETVVSTKTQHFKLNSTWKKEP